MTPLKKEGTPKVEDLKVLDTLQVSNVFKQWLYNHRQTDEKHPDYTKDQELNDEQLLVTKILGSQKLVDYAIFRSNYTKWVEVIKKTEEENPVRKPLEFLQKKNSESLENGEINKGGE